MQKQLAPHCRQLLAQAALAQLAAYSQVKGTRDRVSTMCTLSQNGYGDGVALPTKWKRRRGKKETVGEEEGARLKTRGRLRLKTHDAMAGRSEALA